MSPLPPGWELSVAAPEHPGEPLSRGALSFAVNQGGWEHRRPTLFVLNDASRATPTALILSLVDPPLPEWPEARFIVATGSHPPPGPRELGSILGRSLLTRVSGRVLIHDPGDPALVTVGRTGRGTAVAVPRALLEAEAVVAIDSAEPHYFAGVTGGRKSLVPGLASLETIRGSHRLAREAGARPLGLAGNPVHEDLEEACSLVLRARGVKGATGVQSLTLVHRGTSLFRAERGPVLGAAARALPAVESLFAALVTRPYPAVIAEPGSPLDRDFYQAMKAFEHTRHVVAEGGLVVLDAACPGGLGPEHFARLLEGIADPAGFAPDFGAAYRLGEHKVANLLDYLRGGRRLFLAVGSPPRGIHLLERLGVEVFPSVGEALAESGCDDRRALLVRDAGTVVPRIASGGRAS